MCVCVCVCVYNNCACLRWFHYSLSLPPASQPFIEKKGFLYKMGGKRKNWNLRYFILRPGVFTYSKNPSSKTLGEVKLKNLQVFFPGIGRYLGNNVYSRYFGICLLGNYHCQLAMLHGIPFVGHCLATKVFTTKLPEEFMGHLG